MKTTYSALLLALGSLTGLTTGCLDLKPKPDPTRYFVLSSIEGITNQANLELSLGIRRIDLPEYLKKRWLATRQGNEIRYSQMDEWAEELGQGMQRVLTENLARLVGSDQISVNRWNIGEVQYELSLTVEKFEMNTQGQGTLSVRWQIFRGQDGKLLHSERSVLTRHEPAAAENPTGTVVMLSGLLADFSLDLAAKLKEVSQP